MKTVLLFFVGLLGFTAAQAQGIEEAKSLIYHERYTTAEDLLRKAIEKEPANAESWYLLGQAYIGANHAALFADTLEKADAAVKEQPLLKALKGYLLLQGADSAAAINYFTEALKKTKSKDPAVLKTVAKAYIDARAGDANYAVELLQKAIKKDKDNASLYVLMGDAYRKLGDGGNAYKSYMAALEHDPRYAEAEYKIGKIYTSQKNPSQYLPAFQKAVALDSMYAPALYELYYHYYYTDVKQAKNYLEKYIAATGSTVQNDYLYTDILYASGDYEQAIKKADALIAVEGTNVQPRLYKLEAYSHQAMGDSLKAASYMTKYFKVQDDTAFIAKDYEAMGDIYAVMENKQDSAAFYLAKAASMEQDSSVKAGQYKKISALYKAQKDYQQEAKWLGKYYAVKPSPSNVDLFNWGLASYLAKDYPTADTIFTMYETKYPNEEYGPYWRAKTNAAIDTAMEMGLAVPHYMHLIEVLEKDSTGQANKSHLIEAFGYIAAYKANTQKDYESAVDYFEKLLALDPNNSDAKRYVEILKKTIAKNEEASNQKSAPTDKNK